MFLPVHIREIFRVESRDFAFHESWHCIRTNFRRCIETIENEEKFIFPIKILNFKANKAYFPIKMEKLM